VRVRVCVCCACVCVLCAVCYFAETPRDGILSAGNKCRGGSANITIGTPGRQRIRTFASEALLCVVCSFRPVRGESGVVRAWRCVSLSP
jgi:hypothetical protein